MNESPSIQGMYAMKPVMRKAVQYILNNFAEEISLDDLADVAGISKYNLCRKFQSRYGISPMRWLWVFRARLAAEFIKVAPAWSLTDVAFNCGFTSSAHFSRTFTLVHGVSPSEFRSRIRMQDKAYCKRRGFSEFANLYQNNAKAVSSAYQRMMSEISLQTN